MIVLGIVLILLGALLGVPVIGGIGVLLVIVGLVLAVLGAVGRGVGGRRHYF